MEIFITLTKYNTCQQREEGNPLLMVTTRYIFTHFTIASNVFMRIGTYTFMFIGMLYNCPNPSDLLWIESISFSFRVNVDSLCIYSFPLTLSFLYFYLKSFPRNAHIKCVKKNFHRPNIHWSIVLFIYMLAFCADFFGPLTKYILPIQ